MKLTLPAIKHWLLDPIAPQVLGIFRIGFGLFMVIDILWLMSIDLVRNMFVLPATNFKYDFFYWLNPMPEMAMDILMWLLLLAAIGITIGVLFRWASLFFALGYLYVFLLDKSLYNNHIYLFIVLAFLLSFTDADRLYSVGHWKNPITRIPRWQMGMLQLQMVIVYFYGGLAKLTYDWLFRCEPVVTLVNYMKATSPFSILKSDFGIGLLTYGGLALDLLAPLLLWIAPIRKWAIVLFIAFHVMNAIIFQDIGIFPYVMLFSLILFYKPQELPLLKRIWRNQVVKPRDTSQTNALIKTTRMTGGILAVYFVFQLLFPLRGHFLPNDLDWTTMGNRFSWRMKVNTRQIEALEFSVRDGITKQPYPVNVQSMLNETQILNLAGDPRSIKDFSLTIAQQAAAQGIHAPEVYANVRVRYNGRQAQSFVDPSIDLQLAKIHWSEKVTWVNPVDNNLQ